MSAASVENRPRSSTVGPGLRLEPDVLVAGPWAIERARPGPLDAKKMEGSAWALARVTNQHLKAGTPAFSGTAKYGCRGFTAAVAVS
jgi:hypothetical protein